MSELQRMIRHLDFVRTRIGEEHAERVAAFILVSADDPPAWVGLGHAAAGLLEAHQRILLAIGYHRRLTDGLGSEELSRLEASIVTAALNAWLPRLKVVGPPAHKRMKERGLAAVFHHLIQLLASAHDDEPVLAAASAMQDCKLAVDMSLDAGAWSNAETLAKARLEAQGRLLRALAGPAAAVGWEALACLWVATFHTLGCQENDFAPTNPYTDHEAEEAGSFDLLAAYQTVHED